MGYTIFTTIVFRSPEKCVIRVFYLIKRFPIIEGQPVVLVQYTHILPYIAVTGNRGLAILLSLIIVEHKVKKKNI